jgi:hypothetical protein
MIFSRKINLLIPKIPIFCTLALGLSIIYFPNLFQFKINSFNARKSLGSCLFTEKPLIFVLFMYKPLEFYKNTTKLF